MALGRRVGGGQEGLFYATEAVAGPGHPFYRKLNGVLAEGGFDRHCESACGRFYAGKVGRPGLAPGVYFRLLLIGYFEGIGSERGICWRVADSLSLREFIGYAMSEATPDHVTVSRTRRLLDGEAHQSVFDWVLTQVARRGLLKGKTIGVDATTLEANAAMRSLERRETGESYQQYLQRLAEAAGIDPEDEDAVRRMDRKRKKKMSNEDWVNPNDPDAGITKMKDGTTHVAYKSEEAVDLETGAIVAMTVHSGAVGDTESMEQTLVAAGAAVAEQIATETNTGEYVVNENGMEEVVADKGYHSGAVLLKMDELGLRGYISEPDRGRRKWRGKHREQAAVYANRRRTHGKRGKCLMRRRGEYLERPFAHQYETGGLRRMHVRGLDEVFKRVVGQASAFNLGLILRKMTGAGTPRTAAEARILLAFTFYALWIVLNELPDAQGNTAAPCPIRVSI